MCLNVKLLWLIVIVTFVNHPRVNGYEIRFSDIKTCINKRFTTSQYDYSETFEIDKIQNESGIFLTFYVKGDRDAHIIFSPEPEGQPTTENAPAYEIVLGSDGNTRSSIRSARTGVKKEKETAEKSMMLSNDLSEFWIRIIPKNKSEEIQVGKGNGSAALTWENPNRMTIKHYGFAGFKNSKVNWALPCSQKIKNATELEKELFANYTISDSREPRNITFKSHSAIVNGVSLDINVTISTTWKEDKLPWNSSESDFKELKVNFARVTKPTVVIHNFTLVDSGDVAISPDGIVTWEKNYKIKLESCLPEGDSPYRPLLKCPIKLGFLGEDITFIASNDSSPNVPSLFFDLNETMISTTANTTIHLKYTRRNIKRIQDPNREQIQMDLQKTDTKVSSTDGTASENPTTKNSVSENPTTKNSVSENSVSENPTTKNSVSENPATKNFVSENSVSENPTTKTPSTNPTSDNSTTKKPESKK